MRRVAICGFGETWKEAPFDEPGVVIYGLNELYKYLPRWDEWIEVHDEESIGLTKRVGPEQVLAETEAHRAWLERRHDGKTIWMQERFCDGRFPAAKPFPLERLRQTMRKFQPLAGRDYFTSSVALMIAHVLTEGRDENLEVVDDKTAASWIGLFGIELIGAKEYEDQRPCVEWLIGLCTGKGLTVYVPNTAALMKSDHVYGYERPPQEVGPVTMGRINQRVAFLEKAIDEQVTGLHKLHGALAEAKNWRTVMQGSTRGVVVLPPNFLGPGQT